MAYKRIFNDIYNSSVFSSIGIAWLDFVPLSVPFYRPECLTLRKRQGDMEKLTAERIRDIIENGEGQEIRLRQSMKVPELDMSGPEVFTAIDNETGKPVEVNGQVALCCQVGDKVKIVNRKLLGI